MLGLWISHADYQKYVVGKLMSYAVFDPHALLEYEDVISKLYILFMNRIYRLDERPRVKPKKRKPKKKYGKGEKMPPKHKGVVAKLVARILKGRRQDKRPESVLQRIFARVSVDVSLDMGLVSRVATVSGDGTCLHTGASPYGRKTCGYKPSLPQSVGIDQSGVPLCPAGRGMIYWGAFKDGGKTRIKRRCPRKAGKSELCDVCKGCSDSHYGRVIYTRRDDIRIFTRIPRGTPLWKRKMKERAAAERVNNRILNHYGLEHTKQRGKKRISFFVTIAAVNIHLDAQLAKLKADKSFDFKGTFGFDKAS
jgi:hypothetical protein